jgi:uncharacterized protein YcbX
MKAEPLGEVAVGWNGFEGDRRWAFVRGGHERSGFPWFTMREEPRMGQYTARFIEPDRPDHSVTMVTTPSGAELDVVDPLLAAELGDGARVIKQDRGVFDTMPLSLTTTQTIAALATLAGIDLDPRRFRPNLLIEASSSTPFMEDEWVGAVLRIGTMRMRVDKRDKRCVMVNVDPQTAEKNPAVLRAIALERQSCLGVYGTVVAPGRVAVGDGVEV